MATDVEKLVVQLSADFKSYENAMAKASGMTRSQLAAIKADATQAGAAGAAAFDGASRGIQRFGTQAQKTGANIVNLRGQTANLGAQFQDIAVQLQSGASPLTIALQQGTQISAVLGGAGAGGAVKALGAAFASIVSPVSLVTIGLIAAGGAAVQYFSNMADKGEQSEAQLREQAQLLRDVNAEWGNLLPAVQEYIDGIEETKRVTDLLAAQKTTEIGLFAGPLEDVQRMQAEVLALSQSLARMSNAETATELTKAFAELEAKLADGKDGSDEARAALALLDSTTGGAAQVVANLKEQLNALIPSLDAAAAAAGRAGAQFATARDNLRLFKAAEAQSRIAGATGEQVGGNVLADMARRNDLNAEDLKLENEIADVRAKVITSGGIAAKSEVEAQARENLATEKLRAAEAKAASAAAKGPKGPSKEERAAEREREAVIKLIEALQFEQSLIGLSNLEREKANALRKAGAAATDEQRAQIEAIVVATYDETEALRQSEDALERLRGLSRDVLGGMFEDLRDGADAAEVLANALNRVGENLIAAGLDNLIAGAFPKPGAGGGGNWWERLIGASVHHAGGVVGQPGPSRMVSPAIFAGAPRYHNGGVAGLRPGEVPAILQKGETVIPRGAGGSTAIVVDVSGARGNQEIMSMVEAGVSRGLRAYDSTMPERVMRISADPRKRR